jgi:hypothetical protein
LREEEMTKIAIRIDHENLPRTKSNMLDAQMSAEEIEEAARNFEHELSVIAGDSTLKVAKTNSVRGRETIYVITSSLGRDALVRAAEKALRGLKLGGAILPEL